MEIGNFGGGSPFVKIAAKTAEPSAKKWGFNCDFWQNCQYLWHFANNQSRGSPSKPATKD
jgi:hypothetical protein